MNTGEKRISVGIAVIVFAAILSVVHLFSAQAVSESARPAAPASPEAAAEFLWRTILTTQCQGSGPSPVTFYGQPAPPRGEGVIYEFRDSWTKVLPSRPLDEADRLNGLQFTGVAILGYSSYRSMAPVGAGSTDTPHWSSFENGTNKRSAIKSPKDLWCCVLWSDPLPHYDQGMTVNMEENKGQWSFTLETLGPLSDKHAISSDMRFRKDTLQDAAVKRSCAALTSANPDCEPSEPGSQVLFEVSKYEP